jgi:phenylacetate-CoA ligase
MVHHLNSPLGLPLPHIKSFLIHAANHSPYYRKQDWAINLLAGLPIRLQDIEITQKSLVQQDPQAFRSEFDPPSAGTADVKHTSGSTGIPLVIAKSASHFAINHQENQRLLSPWNLGEHRISVSNMPLESGKVSGEVENASPAASNSRFTIYTNSVEELASFILARRPSYVFLRPSMAVAMLQEPRDFSFLRLLHTTFETAGPELGPLVRKLGNCRHLDYYGSVETGLIGVTCHACGNYHLAERNCLFEVLNDAGKSAGEGETGRLVATVFSNPATPLIRYDLGDIVKATYASPCTPGKLAFTSVLGRERMMFIAENGQRIWPVLLASSVMELGIKRFKMVQTSSREIEFRYETFVSGHVVTQEQLQHLVDSEMAPLFKIIPKPTNDFPRTPSGKYLIHERLIP